VPTKSQRLLSGEGIDYAAKTDEEITTWVSRLEKAGETRSPLYRRLIEERSSRQPPLLQTEVSLRHLTATARSGKFTTYGDLAAANGAEWSKARHLMNGAHGHLDQLLDICFARDLPLLPAICVNKEGVRTGDLSPEALNGFAAGARRLGLEFGDDREFLRECQQRCFEWAKAEKQIPS